jgi:hypothetical protein
MTTTCAKCRAEVGDAEYCPRCGQAILSPQSTGTDTAERPAVRYPVVPAPAGSMPGPARFPMYADQLGEAAHAEPTREVTLPAPRPPHVEDDDDGPGRAAAWLAWVVVALVMVLVAAAGIWLLFSPSGEDAASDPPTTPRSTAQDTATEGGAEPSASTPEEATPSESSPPPAEPAPTGDPVDVAATASAQAPRTAPPNADAFGNRTTYVAANMLDGRPDTCWRMAGDGTGAVLTFRLASTTTLTRVGLINGYAKNAVVGGRNLNWYIGNRRVLAVQWVFDDGSTVDQPLGETKKMQTIDLGTPVTTATVELRLLTVTLPGSGRSARNYTAVSEVTLVGTPSA